MVVFKVVVLLERVQGGAFALSYKSAGLQARRLLCDAGGSPNSIKLCHGSVS